MSKRRQKQQAKKNTIIAERRARMELEVWTFAVNNWEQDEAEKTEDSCAAENSFAF